MRQKDRCDPVVARNSCDVLQIKHSSGRRNNDLVAINKASNKVKLWSRGDWWFSLVFFLDTCCSYKHNLKRLVLFHPRLLKPLSLPPPPPISFSSSIVYLLFPRYPPPPLSSPPCAVNDGHNEWSASLLSAPAALTSLVYWEAVWFSLACQISRIVFAGDCR